MNHYASRRCKFRTFRNIRFTPCGILVDQLDGTIELYSVGRTEFRVVFTEINQKVPLNS
jgi:hypothetical protein